MKSILSILICLTFLTPVTADEGMWLPMLIKRLNIGDMQKKGLKLTAEEIYSINQGSLKDAIVSFNGYCTGEVISKNGLILTNHHCGFDAIQNHSTLENDYLGNGFWAKNYDEELKNEGLFVDFLIKMEDVTSEVLDSINYSTDENTRNALIAERIKLIKDNALKDSSYWAEIKPFFGGNEYYLFIYERYNDIRLVGAPPESIGKFGGDTDNWMWPRHTGDFSLFRVYTSPDGLPSEYSEENVPLKPKYHLPISLDGVEQDDFAMVMGYPGGTDRYLSSFGVKSAIETYNPTVVDIRAEKLSILNSYMSKDRSINIMYASKKARISNYWKYYIGQTKGLKKLNIYNKKQAIESNFNDFVNGSEENKLIYGNVVSDIEAAYNKKSETTLSRVYLNEAAWGGASFVQLCRRSEGLLKALESKDSQAIEAALSTFKERVEASFKEYNKQIDKDIFIKMMEMYNDGVPENQKPDIITKMASKYKGDFKRWGNDLYKKSIFVDLKKMNKFLKDPKASSIKKDPAYIIQKSILDNYFQSIQPQNIMAEKSLEVSHRLFIDGLRKMSPSKNFYPDANFTMRLTYGSVGSYSPGNAMSYDFSTTLEGVMEKLDNDDAEFIVPDKLVELYTAKDYGSYANDNNEMNVCFISNNDITGGNSGSPVINAKGHLIGCAFDGNWEAMSGDIAFEKKLQRTISVDVRYILFIIDKFANASNIINELTLVKMSAAEKEERERKKKESFIDKAKIMITEFPEIIEERCEEINKEKNISFFNAFLNAHNQKLDVFMWKGGMYNTKLANPAVVKN
jgi:hypothetical protein